MSRDTVLLLGGNGFIGSALAKRLRQNKVPVLIVSHQNEEILAKALPECGTVVHLASATTPCSSARQSSLELPNLSLTLRLLDLLKAHRDTHLIFFSSGGTVYGNPTRLPATEDAPIAPLSNYGAGKASQEAFCEAFRTSGHAVTILRPSNAYGPGQALINGFGLVRTLLEHLHRNTTIEIWGDGQTVRDYVFIDDIISACHMMIDRPEDCETYNVGSGTGYTINELVALSRDTSGRKPLLIHRPARPGDVSKITLSVDRLRALGWAPMTTLEEGLSKTWSWLMEAQR